jgi:hypothetical protein
VNVLLLTSHSIAEYDDLRMLHDLGYTTFSVGAYSDPQRPTDDKRPALPQVPYHADLDALCRAVRESHPQPPEYRIDWAKSNLHPELVEWADTIIVHHFPEVWIAAQWPRIRHKRVIWRTCGQSNPELESFMRKFSRDGLQIVRYSPRERTAFEEYGAFAGEDALIRFGKYPEDWYGWHGTEAVVGNVTQHMAQRGDACGYPFWQAASEGLPVLPAGPGSEVIGGTGALSYDGMRDYLRRIRCYLYTGTQPASYTLGLMEAMLTGVPVVSIGPEGMWLPELFEGHELTLSSPLRPAARLRAYLDDHWLALRDSAILRERALDLFDIAKVGSQWAEFLGAPVPAEMASAFA